MIYLRVGLDTHWITSRNGGSAGVLNARAGFQADCMSFHAAAGLKNILSGTESEHCQKLHTFGEVHRSGLPKMEPVQV